MAFRVFRTAARLGARRGRALAGTAAVAAAAAAEEEARPARPDVNDAEIALYAALNDLCATQLSRLPVPHEVSRIEREFDKEHFYPDGCASCTKMLAEGPCGGLFLRMLWCADTMFKRAGDVDPNLSADEKAKQMEKLHGRCEKVFKGVASCLEQYQHFYPQEYDAIVNSDSDKEEVARATQ